MIHLESVYEHPVNSLKILYDLLKERTPEQSISHKEMPTFEEHAAFFHGYPYKYWAIIKTEHGKPAGAIYLTDLREVGVFVFKGYQKQGIASEAIGKLREMLPGKLLANVNPLNRDSRNLFEKLGGKMIQVTYEL